MGRSDSKKARETTCARERDLRVLPTRRFARMTRRSARALSLIFLLRDVGERRHMYARSHMAGLKITKCRITIATNRAHAHGA